MAAPKLTWSQEQRIARHRLAKAHRFAEHFYAKMREAGVEKPEADKAALQKALAIVDGASEAEWALVTRHINEDNAKRGVSKREDPPSASTVETIKEVLRNAIANIDHAAKQEREDMELFAGLLNDAGPRAANDSERESSQTERFIDGPGGR